MKIAVLAGILLSAMSVFAQTAGYKAVVAPETATFEFPLDPNQTYEWSSGGLTYQWSITVPVSKCEIGFFLYTAMGASPTESGDIHKLLKAGQFSVWCGNKARQDIEVNGFASVNADKLIIQVKDKKNLQRLFAAKPKHLTFSILLELFEKPNTFRVPVTYVSPVLKSKAERDSVFMPSDAGVIMVPLPANPAKHGSPGYYFTINTCNACCYDWHSTAAKSFSSNGMPAIVVAGQERVGSDSKAFAPLRKFEKFYFKDVTRDSEICAQGTLYVGPFPTQNSALKAVEKFPPLLLSIIKNRGTDHMYSPEQLRSLEKAVVVQNEASNNWRYGNDDFFSILGYQLVQSHSILRTEATKSWPLFWMKFSKAVNQKDFATLVKLSASDEDFFDGGGGGTSLEWFKMMSDEWPSVKKAVMNGVTPIKIHDWYGETRVERTTRNHELIFLYAGQRWFFFGVMGD